MELLITQIPVTDKGRDSSVTSKPISPYESVIAGQTHQFDIPSHEPIDHSPGSSKPNRKICPYWYHHGSCTKEDRCKYAHELDPSRQQILAWKPTHSAQGCGLALCPLKDGRQKEKKNEVGPSSVGSQTSATSQVQHHLSNTGSGQKRKFPFRHPDAPSPVLEHKKKVKVFMDYDDEDGEEDDEDIDDIDNQDSTTCFFW